MRDRYMKIHKIMVLKNPNFKEAEKKFTVPEFNFNPAEFPALSNKNVLPTIQEQLNCNKQLSYFVCFSFKTQNA